MSNIWITGVDGFLGAHLADEFKKLGHIVQGNDNQLCSSVTSNNFKTDCCDFEGMRRILNVMQPDVLFHCAALAHEGLSNFSPSFITRNIFEASVATFSAAISAGVRRIVFMSSMARYGRQTLPFHEEQTPKPVDPYGIAKVAAEDVLKNLCETHGIEYVICVPHNIIGERQKYDDPYRNVASIMINRALKNKPLVVYGDGKQKRCFSPIKDCLHSLMQLLDAPVSGEVINIGPDNGEMTVLELAEKINWLTGNKAGITHVSDRPNEVKLAYCTSKKARKLLGFKPQDDIERCLLDMIVYIKSQGTKDFSDNFPIEILTDKTPRTWVDKLI
jgi:UDP-glucose 4-epimerase